MNKVFCIALLMILLSACQGRSSLHARAISSDDKKFSCEELQLEMNDAVFLRNMAERNLVFGASDALTPLSYMATKKKAQSAIRSADDRIAYLRYVYQIKECDRSLGDYR